MTLKRGEPKPKKKLGRPRLPDAEKKDYQRISLNLDKETHTAFKAAVKKTKRSFTSILTDLVIEFIGRSK
jgi:hypothetical protein